MNSCKLVMFSGGLDSTYLLWKMLTTTDDVIHAHHISMRTKAEPRWEMEGIATTNIWLKLMEEVRPFAVSSSVLDFDTLEYTGWDSDAQLYVGARVAANIHDADEVTLVLGVTENDARRRVIRDRVKRNVLNNLWLALIESLDDEFRGKINPTIEFPIKNMTKTEIVQELPTDLREMTWSCRLPVTANGMTVPCGTCIPCGALKTALSKGTM